MSQLRRREFNYARKLAADQSPRIVLRRPHLPSPLLTPLTHGIPTGHQYVLPFRGRIAQLNVLTNHIAIQLFHQAWRLVRRSDKDQFIIPARNQTMPDDLAFDVRKECLAACVGHETLDVVGTEIVQKSLPVVAREGHARPAGELDHTAKLNCYRDRLNAMASCMCLFK
ncbi:MAG: hypothetical protein WD229_08965, partial [Pirellulales bacterium]